MSFDKKNSTRKKFIADLTDDDLYSDAPPVDDSQKISDEKISVTDDAAESKKIPEPRRKTFHSKNFTPHVDDDVEDVEKTSEPKVKRKISHAEISGIIISVVMLGYSLITEDKPLFFLATALLIFLLRPLIGSLFGEHNQAVQNALHGFSIALFFGAILFLFM